MSCYICTKCGCIDNTAVGGYYKNRRHNEPVLCSECNFGKWHNRFEKKHWTSYGKDNLLRMEVENASDFFENFCK